MQRCLNGLILLLNKSTKHITTKHWVKKSLYLFATIYIAFITN